MMTESGNSRLEKFQFRTKTDAKGHYVFDKVSPGVYTVHQLVPNGFVQTTKNPQSITVGEMGWPTWRPGR